MQGATCLMLLLGVWCSLHPSVELCNVMYNETRTPIRYDSGQSNLENGNKAIAHAEDVDLDEHLRKIRQVMFGKPICISSKSGKDGININKLSEIPSNYGSLHQFLPQNDRVNHYDVRNWSPGSDFEKQSNSKPKEVTRSFPDRSCLTDYREMYGIFKPPDAHSDASDLISRSALVVESKNLNQRSENPLEESSLNDVYNKVNDVQAAWKDLGLRKLVLSPRAGSGESYRLNKDAPFKATYKKRQEDRTIRQRGWSSLSKMRGDSAYRQQAFDASDNLGEDYQQEWEVTPAKIVDRLSNSMLQGSDSLTRDVALRDQLEVISSMTSNPGERNWPSRVDVYDNSMDRRRSPSQDTILRDQEDEDDTFLEGASSRAPEESTRDWSSYSRLGRDHKYDGSLNDTSLRDQYHHGEETPPRSDRFDHFSSRLRKWEDNERSKHATDCPNSEESDEVRYQQKRESAAHYCPVGQEKGNNYDLKSPNSWTIQPQNGLVDLVSNTNIQGNFNQMNSRDPKAFQMSLSALNADMGDAIGMLRNETGELYGRNRVLQTAEKRKRMSSNGLIKCCSSSGIKPKDSKRRGSESLHQRPRYVFLGPPVPSRKKKRAMLFEDHIQTSNSRSNGVFDMQLVPSSLSTPPPSVDGLEILGIKGRSLKLTLDRDNEVPTDVTYSNEENSRNLHIAKVAPRLAPYQLDELLYDDETSTPFITTCVRTGSSTANCIYVAHGTVVTAPLEKTDTHSTKENDSKKMFNFKLSTSSSTNTASSVSKHSTSVTRTTASHSNQNHSGDSETKMVGGKELGSSPLLKIKFTECSTTSTSTSSLQQALGGRASSNDSSYTRNISVSTPAIRSTHATTTEGSTPHNRNICSSTPNNHNLSSTTPRYRNMSSSATHHTMSSTALPRIGLSTTPTGQNHSVSTASTLKNGSSSSQSMEAMHKLSTVSKPVVALNATTSVHFEKGVAKPSEVYNATAHSLMTVLVVNGTLPAEVCAANCKIPQQTVSPMVMAHTMPPQAFGLLIGAHIPNIQCDPTDKNFSYSTQSPLFIPFPTLKNKNASFFGATLPTQPLFYNLESKKMLGLPMSKHLTLHKTLFQIEEASTSRERSTSFEDDKGQY